MSRKRIIFFLIACALFCSSCAFIPKEEELPAAPKLINSKKSTYTMVEVVRGDIRESFPGKCRSQAAKEEQ